MSRRGHQVEGPSPVDPLEARLLLAVARAPEDPGLRGVLADWLSERGDPWGAFMQAELAGAGPGLQHLATAARPSLLRALGLEASAPRHGLHTTWGLPTAVELQGRLPPTDRPAWALVERLDLGPQHRHAGQLLRRGEAAHGWPRLALLSGLNVDDLWRARPWGEGRLRGLSLDGTTARLIPGTVLRFLGPRPVSLELQGEHRLSILRRRHVPELRVASLPSPVEADLREELLFEALARFLLPGDELVWAGAAPGRALQRRLERELPPHRSRVEASRRPIFL